MNIIISHSINSKEYPSSRILLGKDKDDKNIFAFISKTDENNFYENYVELSEEENEILFNILKRLSKNVNYN